MISGTNALPKLNSQTCLPLQRKSHYYNPPAQPAQAKLPDLFDSLTLGQNDMKREAGARVEVYTDGACKGNPGPGGWAWVVPGGRSDSGAEQGTTNNRMELTAAVKAVESFDEPLLVVTDSRYLADCFKNGWWVKWESNHWLTASKKPVKNQDLWRPLIEAYKSGKVEFEWVKAHAGHPGNEAADQLANQAISVSGFCPEIDYLESEMEQTVDGRIVVYTDGACKGNPGPGGWAWVVLGEPERSDKGVEKATTNNRMELTAAVKAVESFEEPLLVVTDSRYLADCFKNRWWAKWESNNWRNASKTPVKNANLWRPLIEAHKSGKVEFQWIKAHAGHLGNEAADRLANQAVRDAGF